MARRVSEEDIININEAYLICKNYTKVAESTGWSVSTVKKYIIDGYVSKNSGVEHIVNLPPIEEVANFLKSHSNLTILTDNEKIGTEKLWKEMII